MSIETSKKKKGIQIHSPFFLKYAKYIWFLAVRIHLFDHFTIIVIIVHI